MLYFLFLYFLTHLLPLLYGLFYAVVYFVMDACLFFIVFVSFFNFSSTKPRDWLGRTSPKWRVCFVSGWT